MLSLDHTHAHTRAVRSVSLLSLHFVNSLQAKKMIFTSWNANHYLPVPDSCLPRIALLVSFLPLIAFHFVSFLTNFIVGNFILFYFNICPFWMNMRALRRQRADLSARPLRVNMMKCVIFAHPTHPKSAWLLFSTTIIFNVCVPSTMRHQMKWRRRRKSETLRGAVLSHNRPTIEIIK